MDMGVPLYSRDGYRIYAIPTDAARAVRSLAYLVTTGAGSALRAELAFEDARRWLDAWIESRMELGFPRRQPPAKARVRR